MDAGLEAGRDSSLDSSNDAGSDASNQDAGGLSCSSTGTGDITCWFDPVSNLTWTTQVSRPFCYWDGAVGYCDQLVICGHDDWHLPSVDELRSLIRGCAATETGGICPVHDGSGGSYNVDLCHCDPYVGPGPGGCYWDNVFGSSCSWLWSSSWVNGASGIAFGIDFGWGYVTIDGMGYEHEVVCVRSGQ